MTERGAARLAARGPRPKALAWQPQPPIAGDPATARRLVGGVLLFGGRLVETDQPLPWKIKPPDAVWAQHLHGHGWLDDAAAANETGIWQHLSAWAWDWLEHFEPGSGAGWRPDLVARRLTRQIAYSIELLKGQPAERSRRLFDALGTQTRFLGMRWHMTRPGVERLEALAGYVSGLLSLGGKPHQTRRAIADLGEIAGAVIGPSGGIASRNPEDLARIVSLLAWSATAIEEAEFKPHPSHLSALNRAASALRLVRHPGGGLACFHGGRSGSSVPLGRLLKQVSARALAPPLSDAVMGFLRLEAGSSVCIVDSAPPPGQAEAATAHASALALDVSLSGQPVIVQCGSGLGFGERSARAARRAPSHSSVEIAGECPASVQQKPGARPADLLTTSGTVQGRRSRDNKGAWAFLESTQYVAQYGLVVERRLHLSAEGDRLSGEDTVLATNAETRARAVRKFRRIATPGPIVARFHLHPDVEAEMALADRAIALRLTDGSRWVMRTDADRVRLMPSVFHDENRPKPRATSQIVAEASLLQYWGRITWSFERLVDERDERTKGA
ncbi:MAG: heparinase II/III family protein [Pseudomonadota bacterium]